MKPGYVGVEALSRAVPVQSSIQKTFVGRSPTEIARAIAASHGWLLLGDELVGSDGLVIAPTLEAAAEGMMRLGWYGQGGAAIEWSVFADNTTVNGLILAAAVTVQAGCGVWEPPRLAETEPSAEEPVDPRPREDNSAAIDVPAPAAITRRPGRSRKATAPMHRTTVEYPQETLTRMKLAALAQQTSVGDLVRAEIGPALKKPTQLAEAAKAFINVKGIRTTIDIDQAQHRRLKTLAAEKGVTVQALILAAIAGWHDETAHGTA